MQETHLLIIWSNAIQHADIIINDLKENFLIKRIFLNSWKKEDFLNNLIRFYAHSQKHQNLSNYTNILKNKIEHCGDNEFYIIIFEDKSPRYEIRKTSTGDRPVNINIFDKKKYYRDLTGGGHKIHATDNQFEVNKDLTLLFHKNKHDFYKYHEGLSDSIEKIQLNCLGINGFKHVKELFYLLNNTINYCVIRNFECLPNEYTLKDHGDIDLLVEDLNYIVYLTDAKPVYPDLEYRVHYTLKIDNKLIPFDFRYLGDGYYDIKWQAKILSTKKKYNNIFVPNDTEYFYSLLYHAYIQKPNIKPDYKERLHNMAVSSGISYTSNISDQQAVILLQTYLTGNNFNFSTPKDHTVFFNKILADSVSQENIKIGDKISQSIIRCDDIFYTTEVYKQDDLIHKIGTNHIINNEYKYLKKLQQYSQFPKVHEYNQGDTNSKLEIEFIDAQTLTYIANNSTVLWNESFVGNFINDFIDILIILIKQDIIHRDIRPDNILVNASKAEFKIFLIDFGWSIDTTDNTPLTPQKLGSYFRYSNSAFSDPYSFGMILQFYFGRFYFARDIIKTLKAISPHSYLNKDTLIKELYAIKKIKIKITLKDKVFFLLKRNKNILYLTRKFGKLYK